MGNFKENINKIFKDSKISNLVAIVIVLILIFIVISFFGGKSKETLGSGIGVSENTESKQDIDANKTGIKENETLAEYETRQKTELKEIIEKMDGVGKVDVKINFESGEIKVPATDDSKQINTTEEKDTSGGTRTSKNESDGSKVVMSGGSDGNTPLIVKVDRPKIAGIIIVAEGAENSKIKLEIERACATLYDMPANKVHVQAMKKQS